MKQIPKFLILILSLIMMISCGKPGDKVSVVRTRTMSEIDSLDPYISSASDTDAIMHNVFEGLAGYTETGDIIPALAEGWDILDDGTTYVFHLRDNVRFHDGTAFSSADVRYSIAKYAGLDTGKPLSSKFRYVKECTVIDDMTVEVRLSQPDSSFLSIMTYAMTKDGYEENGTSPIGTGPYRFVSYTPGQKVVLERFTDYWNPERGGSIDRAEFLVMTDESAVVTALASGQLDFAIVNGDNVNVFRDGFDIYSDPQNMVQLLGLNNTVAPFDNELVRKALCCAVDRQEIIDGAFSGYATPIYSAFSPVMESSYNPDLDNVYRFDPDRARALLAEAGYPDGFEMVITVPSNYQPHIDTAQIISEQLKKVGIDCSIELVEWATWLDRVHRKAEYQSTVIGLSGKLDPGSILIRYSSVYRSNFVRYNNSAYDDLMDRASRESDAEKRSSLYRECQKLLTYDAASVFICDPNQNIVCRRNLKGYTAYPVPFTDLAALYWEDQN